MIRNAGGPISSNGIDMSFVGTNDTTDTNLVPGGVYMENVRGQPTWYIYYFIFCVWSNLTPGVYMIYGERPRPPKI